MTLFNFFKPKWQHKNPSIRLEAVKRLDESDQDRLANIVKEDQDLTIRQTALIKINRLDILESLLSDSNCAGEINNAVASRIIEINLDKVLHGSDDSERTKALSQIDNQNILAQVVLQSKDIKLRLNAVDRISDKNILSDLLKDNCGKEAGLAAIDKISDKLLLEEIAKEGTSKHVRNAAKRKAVEQQIPSPKQKRKNNDRKLVALLKEAEALAEAPDPETAKKKLNEIEIDWRRLEGFENKELNQRFSAVVTELDTRLRRFQQHKEVSRKHLEELSLLREKTTRISQEISGLLELPNDVNLDKFNALNLQWQQLTKEARTIPQEVLEDFQSVQKKFQDNRTRYLKEKSTLEGLKKDWSKIVGSLAKNEDSNHLESLFTKISNSLESQNFIFVNSKEFSDEFKEEYIKFIETKSIRKEKQEKIYKENLNARKELLQEIITLTNSEDKVAADNRVKEIKKIWAKHAPLPDNFAQIEQDFLDAVAKFNQTKQEYYQQRDWQRWTNKTIKEKIIAQLESLDTENDLHLVFKTLKTLQQQWNNTGEIPAKDAKKLWSRFKNASDRNFKRCQQFFQELDKKAEVNLQHKMELLKKACEKKDSTNWKEDTDFFKNLQADWKKIGRAPKDKEKEIFLQFRDACNHFFDRRKTHINEQDQQRLANLTLKQELCLEVENLVSTPEKDHKQKIMELQAQWKTIGPVPKVNEEEIWQRFRGACNSFYQWLDQFRPENLIKKRELVQQAEELVKSLDPQYNNLENIANEMSSLQKEWQTIGPAPETDNKEIWRQFRGTCDSFYAIRKKYYQELDLQRSDNEARKREIISEVEKLAKEDNRENVRQIILLQEEWKGIGPALKENERNLQDKFRQICNDFFEDKRQHYEEMDRIRRDNLKKKEELCIRIELLAGVSPGEIPGQSHGVNGKQGGVSLGLAEQLKIAFESNFVISGGDEKKERNKKEQISLIKKEWQQLIGQVPKEHEHYIKKRYQKALDAFYNSINK